ncbi:F-box/kelch-repeat protein At3g23880-like [Vicia villosa]|uniref:F-box/kelch-repeat protein At3g23880-like n=1 Tax=Vicia villosa TaxID=3911 RepID=UPI00273A97D4|nr:F-box/kelch-repeat protein At3g23880-like [Vicia villosa]
MMSMVLPSNRQHKINAPSPITLPEELIVQILSMLNVKSLMKLKCVSKSWNSIISDPFFVKMHLDKSSRIPHMMLFLSHIIDRCLYVSLHLSPVRGFLENPSIDIFNKDSKCQRMEWLSHHRVIGSCNGLVCLLNYCKNEFYLWNPATTRPFSENLVSYPLAFQHQILYYSDSKVSFGYDNLTNKYKLVAFYSKEVIVFTFEDNVWKNIKWFSVSYTIKNNGIYLSNSLNWSALLDNKGLYKENLNVEQLVIISLDLGTETYTKFQFPREFDELLSLVPIVCKLMDSLCFYHYAKEHSFVIWQMKEFGVEESWTKFLKFDYHSLSDCSRIVDLLPLHVFENGDMLILENNVGKLIRYYRKDNRVVWKPAHTNNCMLFSVIPYVESLVSTF